jgi:hypothetical protein
MLVSFASCTYMLIISLLMDRTVECYRFLIDDK